MARAPPAGLKMTLRAGVLNKETDAAVWALAGAARGAGRSSAQGPQELRPALQPVWQLCAPGAPCLPHPLPARPCVPAAWKEVGAEGLGAARRVVHR